MFKRLAIHILLMFGLLAPVASVDASTGMAADIKQGRIIATVQGSDLGRLYYLSRHPTQEGLEFARMVTFERFGNDIQMIAPVIRSELGVVFKPNGGQGDSFGNWATESTVIARFPIIGSQSDGEVSFDLTDYLIESRIGIPSTVGGVNKHGSNADTAVTINDVLVLRLTVEFEASEHPLSNGLPIIVPRVWSIRPLPDDIMEPRQFDPRMAFMIERMFEYKRYQDYTVGAIARFRLERDELSSSGNPPASQIDIYIGPDTPEEYAPFVRAGILSWNAAFEAIGIHNAIAVKTAPEGVDWNVFSAAHTVVLWNDKRSGRDNRFRGNRGAGSGRPTVDFRSGEILRSEVLISDSYELFRDLFFTRCGPLVSGFSGGHYPIEVMGPLIQALAAHEAGHALGLRDGHYGEYAYEAENLRKRDWLETMGFTPSIMNYSRCNYVAQPEDKLPISLLVPKVGPADFHQIKWGYHVFEDDVTDEEKVRFLDGVVASAKDEPWKQFLEDNQRTLGPQTYDEAVDSKSTITSTKLGLRNLEGSAQILIAEAVGGRIPQSELRHLYQQLVETWKVMTGYASSSVSGVMVTPDYNQPGAYLYLPIDHAEQAEALSLVLEELVNLPAWMTDDAFVHRLKQHEVNQVIASARLRALQTLTHKAVRQVFENGALQESASPDFMSSITDEIWSELELKKPVIDESKRSLQALHLNTLIKIASRPTVSRSGPGSASFAGRPKELATIEIVKLRELIEASLERELDTVTRVHLEVSKRQISELMD